jgi:hypothetical protein
MSLWVAGLRRLARLKSQHERTGSIRLGVGLEARTQFLL